MISRGIYTILIMAGALPFIGAMGAFLLDIHQVPILGDVGHALSIYTLGIGAFVLGSHWSLCLTHDKQQTILGPIFTNVLFLVLVFNQLLLPQQWIFLLYASLFCIMLCFDIVLLKKQSSFRGYMIMRMVITLIVVSALVISASYLS